MGIDFRLRAGWWADQGVQLWVLGRRAEGLFQFVYKILDASTLDVVDTNLEWPEPLLDGPELIEPRFPPPLVNSNLRTADQPGSGVPQSFLFFKAARSSGQQQNSRT